MTTKVMALEWTNGALPARSMWHSSRRGARSSLSLLGRTDLVAICVVPRTTRGNAEEIGLGFDSFSGRQFRQHTRT